MNSRGTPKAAESINFSNSDYDSVLKIPTPTPAPAPLRLRLNMRYSITRTAIWCIHFLVFSFDCIETGDTAMQYPFALTTDADGNSNR